MTVLSVPVLVWVLVWHSVVLDLLDCYCIENWITNLTFASHPCGFQYADSSGDVNRSHAIHTSMCSPLKFKAVKAVHYAYSLDDHFDHHWCGREQCLVAKHVPRISF